MTTPSDIHAEAEAVRRTLADVRARLDRQESAILDGFRSLRYEIEALDNQVRSLAQAAAAAPAQATPAASEPAAQPIPVGKVAAPVTAKAVAVGVPVGEPAANPAATTEDFDFGEAEPEVEADASEFNFESPASAPAASRASPESSAARSPVQAHPTAGIGEQIDMEQVMFGPDLAANQSLFDDRNALLQGLYSADPAAMTLLGQLLIFRGATPDRMPGLLKDIGEAYYRWRGGAPDQDYFRDELTGWLQRKCDEAGAPNSIELVRAGDRYDSKRHHSKERGVEVAAVHGWVVLRDNGRVYTKATVTLK